jgi:hypothetical protein
VFVDELGPTYVEAGSSFFLWVVVVSAKYAEFGRPGVQGMDDVFRKMGCI